MPSPLHSAAWGWAGWPSWRVLEVLGGSLAELESGASGYATGVQGGSSPERGREAESVEGQQAEKRKRVARSHGKERKIQGSSRESKA